MSAHETEPRAVAVGVLKGGFAKTTTAINLARELAHRNGSALVVDLDDNGHMTQNLGFAEAYEAETNHVHEVLLDEADPTEAVVNVVDGLDLFPAHQDLEDVQTQLKNAMGGSTRLNARVVEPLLGEEYDYIVVDCPANQGKLNENALFATNNLMIPVRPETGYDSGIHNTVNRLVKEARQYFELDILAVVPSGLSQRLDQDRRDRALLEEINSMGIADSVVPEFCRLTDDDWAAIDDGSYDGPLPGIRYRSAIDDANDAGQPLRDYDGSCDQLSCYAELAEIVERGGIVRDGGREEVAH
ncbi:ParA family protein [Halobaculum marinum]|uniref:ParA family protein n=1 Tax=Halobaculum marinum TaxID=3031996 RepID=A0ABD5X3V4_9EURY|nr:ParA family protein [Halobaculum sp. DT55]